MYNTGSTSGLPVIDNFQDKASYLLFIYYRYRITSQKRFYYLEYTVSGKQKNHWVQIYRRIDRSKLLRLYQDKGDT